MRRFAVFSVSLIVLCLAYVIAHWALIEVGREVIVLRTENDDGEVLETRLWIVDHDGHPWLHGGDSGWMHNLRARPIVEVDRHGETHRYHARPLPGPHPEIDALLREKYGIADRWVRFVAPDTPAVAVVRLEPIEGE